MALTLNLAKPGEKTLKLRLNLAKPAKFQAELMWDSPHDLDAHALLATNNGDGAKVVGFEQVLSTYTFKRTVNGRTEGIFDKNADGSMTLPSGALHHSGDALTGVGADIDEVITIDGGKIPAGVNEIPIFVTIHPSKSATFAQVKSAGIRIRNDQGSVLGEYELSKEFGPFDAVQMGSLLLSSEHGWEYAPVGVGFNGDFNSILEHFS